MSRFPRYGPNDTNTREIQLLFSGNNLIWKADPHQNWGNAKLIIWRAWTVLKYQYIKFHIKSLNLSTFRLFWTIDFKRKIVGENLLFWMCWLKKEFICYTFIWKRSEHFLKYPSLPFFLLRFHAHPGFIVETDIYKHQYLFRKWQVFVTLCIQMSIVFEISKLDC